MSTFAKRKPKLTKAETIVIGAAERRHLIVKNPAGARGLPIVCPWCGVSNGVDANGP
jgi:hypothetical protein